MMNEFREIGPEPESSVLQKIAEKLNEKINNLKDLQKIFAKMAEDANENNLDEEAYEHWIVELCYEFFDCTVCPISFLCPKAQQEPCGKINRCANCPRLRQCVWDYRKDVWLP
jgi:hypothetical protein